MIYRCHVDPDKYEFESDVRTAGEGKIMLAESWLHPGGGGQPSDRAAISGAFGSANIIGVVTEGETCGIWSMLLFPQASGCA
jgi:misacylated tRNA(Ala) deacylase